MAVAIAVLYPLVGVALGAWCDYRLGPAAGSHSRLLFSTLSMAAIGAALGVLVVLYA